MIANIETISFEGSFYMTELTYAVSTYRKNATLVAHYFIQHPGANATDALFREMDPEYHPPIRYSLRPPVAVFLTEHLKYSPDNVVYIARDKIKLLRGFIQIAQPWPIGATMPDFEALEDHFSDDSVADIMEELRLARQKALNP